MRKTHLVDFEDVELIHETSAAWLFIIEDKEVWVPKSVGDYDARSNQLTLPEHFAISKELV